MVLEVVTLIVSVAFFIALLLSVHLSNAAGSLGYILGILLFVIIVSVAGTRIAVLE
jgi:C4-dicarboxylate transporter